MPTTFASLLINARPDTIWQFISPFDSINMLDDLIQVDLQPLELSNLDVGVIRVVKTQDGKFFKEKLTLLNKQALTIEYIMTENSYNFTDFKAVIKIIPVIPNEQSLIKWSAIWDTDNLNKSIYYITQQFDSRLNKLKEVAERKEEVGKEAIANWQKKKRIDLASLIRSKRGDTSSLPQKNE